MTPAQARQVSTHWFTVAPADISSDIVQKITWIESIQTHYFMINHQEHDRLTKTLCDNGNMH
jgi:hypothetical protein